MALFPAADSRVSARTKSCNNLGLLIIQCWNTGVNNLLFQAVTPADHPLEAGMAASDLAVMMKLSSLSNPEAR